MAKPFLQQYQLVQQNGNDILYNNGDVSVGNDLTVGSRLDVGSFFKAGNDTVEITSNYSAINSGMFCIGGLMGVGGTVPTVALDVKGDFKLTGNSEVQGTLSLPSLADTTVRVAGIDVNGDLFSLGLELSGCISPVLAWQKSNVDNEPPSIELCAPYQQVGIGKSPTTELDVVGTAVVSGKIGIGTTTPLEKFQLGDIFTFHDGGTKKIARNFYFSNNQDLRIKSGPVAALCMDGSGDIELRVAENAGANTPITWKTGVKVENNDQGEPQVRIGDKKITSGSHTDYKLAVDGKIVSKKAIVTQDNWADFVFDKNYTQPTPKEKHAYTQQHKHLPYMPSEDGIINNGLDVGETMKGITQNVQENRVDLYQLYLRMEKLEAENDALKAEVEQLKKQ